MTILYDVLHLSYNLLYPAILGTFIYDMAHGGNANGAFLSVIWERKMVVLFLYTMDFTVAKKIYASHSRSFTKVKLWASVVAEILTLITLWLSFWNANNPRGFYACIVAFILAGALVHFVVTKGRHVNSNKIFNIILFGSALLTLGLAIQPSWFHERIIPLVLVDLVAAYYLLVIRIDDVIMCPMLVTGELVRPSSANPSAVSDSIPTP